MGEGKGGRAAGGRAYEVRPGRSYGVIRFSCEGFFRLPTHLETPGFVFYNIHSKFTWWGVGDWSQGSGLTHRVP